MNITHGPKTVAIIPTRHLNCALQEMESVEQICIIEDAVRDGLRRSTVNSFQVAKYQLDQSK